MPANKDLIALHTSALDSADNAELLDGSRLVKILLSRDDLDRAESITPEEFGAIRALDNRLRGLAPRIAKEIPRELYPEWQQTAGRRAVLWWWNLEKWAAGPPSATATLVTAAAVTSTLALLTTIVSRFFEGGPDTFGAFAVVLQGLLTILAGAAAADFASNKIDALIGQAGFSPAHRGRTRMVFALAVFLLVLAVRLGLPQIAVLYNNSGAEARGRGDFREAIEMFTRAIALRPAFDAAHYNLAEAYEQSLEYDKAITSYQAAIRAQPKLDLAYNNLARLEILVKQDYSGALRLLDSALALQPAEPPVRFRIYKNRGWANLGLKNYRQAEADLARASAELPKSAAPHCLLAQVKEASGAALKEIQAESALCMQKDKSGVEPYWMEFVSEKMEKK